jgi:hypothetical protein
LPVVLPTPEPTTIEDFGDCLIGEVKVWVGQIWNREHDHVGANRDCTAPFDVESRFAICVFWREEPPVVILFGQLLQHGIEGIVIRLKLLECDVLEFEVGIGPSIP